MKCNEVQNRLDDYVDGALPENLVGGIETHLAGCSECSTHLASIRSLQWKTGALPKAISPGRDLWPTVAGKIGADQAHSRIVQHDFGVGREKAGRRGVLITGWRVSFAVAATIVIAIGSFWFTSRSTGPSWSVEQIQGMPLVDDQRVQQTGQLHIGDWLETDNTSKARLTVGSIGEVEVEPNTRLKLVQSNLTNHRIALQEGTIHATIWAPPRLFFVETPSALAVDLGCAYTLVVDKTGASFLHVTSGYVALEFNGRESVIPAGAMCATRPGYGPGTPFADDASELMRTALMHYDFDHGGSLALRSVLGESRKADALTLWHLLKSTEDSDRELVYDKLTAIAPPPDDVNREGILHGDRDMLERWGKDLGVSGMWLDRTFKPFLLLRHHIIDNPRSINYIMED